MFGAYEWPDRHVVLERMLRLGIGRKRVTVDRRGVPAAEAEKLPWAQRQMQALVRVFRESKWGDRRRR